MEIYKAMCILSRMIGEDVPIPQGNIDLFQLELAAWQAYRNGQSNAEIDEAMDIVSNTILSLDTCELI